MVLMLRPEAWKLGRDTEISDCRSTTQTIIQLPGP